MRHPAWTSIAVLCASITWVLADSQGQNAGQNATSRSLQVTEVVPTEIDQVGTVVPDQCDADGNIYLRPYGANLRFGWGDIVKLSSKGKKLATFSPQQDLDPTAAFVARDGGVYVMAAHEERENEADARRAERRPWTPPEIYILHYRQDGQFDKKTKLAASFLPSGSFVVFPSGEILVSVIEQTDAGKPTSAPFTGLFDQSGTLLKKISGKEDDWIVKAVESHDAAKVDLGKGSNPAIARGQAVVGSDGNAYIMRRSDPAVVYVVSAGGVIVRTLKLSSGDPPLSPSIMAENNGQLAVLFQNFGPSESRIGIFDARNGEELEMVEVGPTFGSAMTCFNPPNFTFIRVQDKKFVFTGAQLR